MKKLLSILLAMVMAFTLLSLPVMAKPHTTLDSDLMPVKETIVNATFDDTAKTSWGDYVDEKIANFWVSSSAIRTNGTIVEDANVSGNKFLSATGTVSLVLKKPSTGTGAWGSKADYNVASNPLSGTYVTEFKFMVPTMPTSEISNFFRSYLNVTDEGNSSAINFRLRNTGYIRPNYDSNSLFQANPAEHLIGAGKWYSLKVVNNVTQKNYDLYLDGILIANDITYKTGNYVPDVFNVPFEINTGSNTVYIDDLLIYKEVVGRQTFAADDFSGNGTDVTYNSTTELREFGGFALYPRNGYQYGVKIDATNERAEFSAGATLSAGFAKTWNAPDNTLTDSLIGKKQVSVEFDFTPSADTVGDFYNITDAVGSHYGLILSANDGTISAKIGAEGDVTPSSANRGVDLASFTAGETYRIKVYVDLDKKFTQNLTGNSSDTHNKAHTRSGKADVYIDGKLVGTELPLRYNCGSASNASYDITNLGRPFAANGGASATYYIDNIAVYTDVREKVLSAALNAVNKTVSQKTFTLPSSTVDGYAITWASNSDAIAISGNTATVTTNDATQKVTLTATVADTAGELAVAGNVDVTVAPDYQVYVKYVNADGDNVYAPAEGIRLNSVTFYDNYTSGKNVDLFVAVFNSDNTMDSCRVVDKAVSGEVNSIEVTLKAGQSVRAFAFTDGTLVPVPFTQISYAK